MRHLILFLLFTSFVFAQNEANIWYFGSQAGLDFNSGSPVALLDSAMTTNEGCSTISNSSGNLLFYTDGVTVWDKNHDVMPNGFGLLGSFTSTQSSVVIPKPGDSNIYYIFTVDAIAGQNGLRYSEVDMTLNNGDGDVTATKNILLLTPTTEKISAVVHANGQDFWLITREWNTNNFHSFLIDANGVNTTAVVSSEGTVHTGNVVNSIGYLKLSPDGKKLAMAKFGDDRLVELFDFDNSTGVISNPQIIDGVFNVAPGADSGLYGIEFSPNSQRLYVSDVNTANFESAIHQFDLTLPNLTDIINSNYEIQEPFSSLGALQLGPDGKLYIARANEAFLGVINNPNELGVDINYDPSGVSLDTRTSLFGLPQFIQSFFNIGIQFENTCFGDTVAFTADLPETYDSLLWDFGDNTTSTDESPTHVYPAPGNYTITLTVTSGTDVALETIVITIFPLPSVAPLVVIEQCDDDTDGFSVFNLNEVNSEISSDFQNQTITFHESLEAAQLNTGVIPNPTAYTNQTVNSDTVWARVQDINGCSNTTQVNLFVTTTQIPDTFIRTFFNCDDGEDAQDGISSFDFSSADADIQALFPAGQQITISYYRDLEDALSEINPITDVSNYQNIGFPNQQEIYVRVDSLLENDCLGLGPYIILNVNDSPIANQVDDIAVCDDQSNDSQGIFNLSDLDATVLGVQPDTTFEILYFNNETDALNNINPLPDEYIVNNEELIYARIQNLNNTNCFDVVSFFLIVEFLPIANPVDDLFLCDDGFDLTEVFDLSSQDDEILSGQSEIENIISYHLSLSEAENNENPIEGSLENTSNPQQVFARLENLNSPSCFTITSFNIEVLENPVTTIPDEFILCEGSPLTIALEDSFDEYLWSTGETTQQITITTPGNYDVTVTKLSNGLSCQDTASFEVIESNPATILDIQIIDWRRDNNSLSIVVEGLGDYEYSINGFDYQDSNTFNNLLENEYTVHIRDKKGCGEVLRTVFLLDYPDFFTPNGDGFNDRWQIINSKTETFTKIYIFDRYGKLLKDLLPTSSGWDGTYQGKPMPSNDYWFRVEREDGRIFSGHFTLKR